MRRDIEFDAGGLTIRGRLYLPNGLQAPVPTVVIGHGFCCVKEMFLVAYAKTFVAAGLGVLVYDNPDIGDSYGTPREELGPWGQIRDYRHAITYACSLPEVDGSRIGLWGTSHTGAHVLLVDAIDNRVKCVVSQVPVVSGHRTAHRATEMFPEHETSPCVDKIGPSPLLMIVEDDDTLAAADQALDIYNRALEPKKLVSFPGEHFDASVRDQEAAATAARDWYLQHLSRPPAHVMTDRKDNAGTNHSSDSAKEPEGAQRRRTQVSGGTTEMNSP